MSNDNTVRIGVVGYSGQSFDELKALGYLAEAFDRIAQDHEGADARFRVVSGTTALGIPRLAYEEAESRGWET